MKEINCNIIRDLLPLYEDGVVSEDTAQLVREHLEGCPACREEYERMHTPASLLPDDDRAILLRLEDELRKKHMIRFFCGVGVLAVLACIYCLWYTWPRSYNDLFLPDAAACQGIEGEAEVCLDIGIDSQQSFSFTPEDAAFSQLLTLLEEQSYRRVLMWGDCGGHAFSPRSGDFRWNITLFYDIPQEDGSTERQMLRITNFYGELLIYPLCELDGYSHHQDFTISDQETWISTIMDIITTQ